MKKLFTALTLLLVLASGFFAGDRLVIVERFTSSTCPPCASNNPIMEAFLNSIDPDRIIGLSYHMNWPAPGNDTMYHYNQPDNDARRSLYSVIAIPQARMDGLISIQSPYSQSALQSYFDSRTNILSPVTIIVTDSTFGDSVMVRARIYCEVMLSNPNVILQFVIREDNITNISPPPTNGESIFTDVMRKMPNTANGQPLTLLPGQTYIIERRFKKDPIWHFDQVNYLVFIQQGQDMINAAQKTNNFTLIPISSYKSVAQGQSGSATYQMSIPVVASGYNSPVALTASVEPPTSGITVSFPNGTNISSFPANFDMQVNTTAVVPAGAYRIIVTGTNGNGKVHKTSVSLLVGKNFIGVAANKSTLQFRVDNQNYTNLNLFTWDLGAQHTLTALSPQIFGATRYVFQSWSDGGDSSHTITTGTTISNYTVNYKTQFKLITNLSPGVPATIAGGNLFYDSASTVNFSVSPTTVQYNGKTWYFQRWVGTGNGSYNGTNSNVTITGFSNVIVETAQFDTIVPFGIQNLGIGIPKSFDLHQNYPNPFNPVTRVKFDIPKSSEVSIKIYDVIGNEVAVVHSGFLTAGYYEAEFNASSYASGVYFYRLETDGFTSVKRMVLIK